MPDVFDRIAPDSPAQASGGDIFDRIAPTQPKGDIFDRIAPAQPKGDIFDRIAPPKKTGRALAGQPLGAKLSPDEEPLKVLPGSGGPTLETLPEAGRDLANAGRAIGASVKRTVLTAAENDADLRNQGIGISSDPNGYGQFPGGVDLSPEQREQTHKNLELARDTALQQEAEATSKIQSPTVQAATPIVKGIGIPMAASAIGGPAAGAYVTAEQFGADIYDTSERELRQRGVGPERRGTASAAGGLGGGAGAAISVVPGANSLPGTLAHGAATGAGFDASAQTAEHLATGKPIDPGQIAGSAAFGAIFAGGMHALHTLTGGKVPPELQQKMEAAQTPEDVQAVIAEAKKHAVLPAAKPDIFDRLQPDQPETLTPRVPEEAEALPAPPVNTSSRTPAGAESIPQPADIPPVQPGPPAGAPEPAARMTDAALESATQAGSAQPKPAMQVDEPIVSKAERDALGAPLEETPTEVVKKPTQVADRIAPQLRKQADALTSKIENGRRDMTQNATPKRMRQYSTRRTEADVLERQQRALHALADAREAGTLPPELENVKSRTQVVPLVARKMAHNGGYYDSYFETHEYQDSSPAGKALQGLLENKTPEQKAAEAQYTQRKKIEDAESKIRFQKIEGFFPTPKPLIDKMVDAADVRPGMKVLEPSAGKGDIADVLKAQGADVDAVELRPALRDIIEAKGHKLVGEDFLQTKGQYDRIVMNPPFERGQDIEHVRHAYDQLKPGGKIVSIMSEGSFSRSGKKETSFRQWLDDVGGDSTKIQGGFAGADAFRQTGVASRMVEIYKPAGKSGLTSRGVGAAGSEESFPAGKASIEELSAAVQKSRQKSAPVARQIQQGAQVGESTSGPIRNAADRFVRAYNSVKGGFSAMLGAYKDVGRDTTYDKATREWSGADNISALQIHRFQKQAESSVPNKVNRGAIAVYIESGGDQTKLDKWAADIRSDPKTRRYASVFDAAAKLSDEHKFIANATHVRNEATLDEARDAGLLKDGIDNYMMHVWKDNPAALRKVAAEANWTSLQTKPSFTKQRTIPTYYDGIKAGFTPRDLDFASLTAAHERSFRQALAARGYIKSLNEGAASDGRPLATISAASAKEIPGMGQDGGYLIKPNIKPGDEYADYRMVDHPALRGWRWAGKDSEGKPIFVQGDMVVHPDIYRSLKNNLTPSALQEYALTRGALRLSSEMKSIVLSFSGFHQTTLGVHALEHRVAPAFMPDIDISNPTHKALIDHGLMVAHYNAQEAFGEGVATGGLLTKVPGIGPTYKAYTDYLFRDYLPRVKMAMAEHALERNTSRYGKTLSKDQILSLTADQANAAFGGLNYRALGRNKTLQDVLRLTLLAPDFLEARGRFVGQAAKPYGREQATALVLGAAAMYTAGAAINQMISGNPHLDKPFTVVVDGREYRLRTVQGDLAHAISDPRGFITTRLSPLVNFAFGLFEKDAKNQYKPIGQQIGKAAKRNVPIPVQSWVQSKSESTAGKTADTILKMIGVSEYTARDQSEVASDKRREARQSAAQAIRQGQGMGTLNQAIKSGTLPPAQRSMVMTAARRTDLQNKVSALNAEKAVEFYEGLSDEDQKHVRLMIQQKILRSKIHSPQEKMQLRKRVSPTTAPVAPASHAMKMHATQAGPQINIEAWRSSTQEAAQNMAPSVKTTAAAMRIARFITATPPVAPVDTRATPAPCPAAASPTATPSRAPAGRR